MAHMRPPAMSAILSLSGDKRTHFAHRENFAFLTHNVGSLRRSDTSGVRGEADMPRTLLNRRD